MAHRTGLRCDASSEARSTHPILCHLRCSSNAVEKGLRSQPACQQTRTCQRRKRRVRGVERGQRSQPAWLRAHPGRRHFQLEKTPRTQTPANVWDTRGGSHTDGVNEIERREVTFLGVGSPSWTRFELSQPARLLRSDPCSRRFNNLRAFEDSRNPRSKGRSPDRPVLREEPCS